MMKKREEARDLNLLVSTAENTGPDDVSLYFCEALDCVCTFEEGDQLTMVSGVMICPACLARVDEAQADPHKELLKLVPR